ncbi:hypothetical protein DYB32_005338 [Aphanomyces invadans]|uniref:ENTH domain-containing protein n=1 Tax=Aphanomyces invadans TaxID=157072 RepID=A0A3R6YYB1_9STRA|nr:hypothetical protein DYB32_005338 [Aphanomyces invadans]
MPRTCLCVVVPCVGQVGAQDGSTEKIAEFLLNRTAKSNMNVKLKAMQVINHCLKGGDPAFHHYMRLNEHAVRVLSNFQGSMDPAYGDEKNRRLRMAALETLNYLGVPASLNNNSGEMIPTRWNSARDNRPTVLIGAKTSLFGAPKPVQPGVGGGNGGVHRMGSHMHHGSSSSGFGNSGTFNPPSYERSLIDDLCPPGGLARAPPAENLNRFVDLAKSLDMNILGDLLLDKLEDDSWQVRLKGLCVWEALLDAPGCEHYAEWLEENVELLQHVAQDPKTAVAIKAKRVLQLIGVDAASHQPVAKPHQHSHEQRPHASVDLLAMNDLTLSGPSVPPPAQQPFHQQQQQQQQQQQVAPANLLDLSFSPLKNAAPTPTTTALDPLSLNAQPSLLLSPPRQLPPEASRHLGDFGKDLFTLANSPRNAAQPSPAPPPTEKSAFSFM